MEITVGLTKALSHLSDGKKEMVQTVPDKTSVADLIDILNTSMPGFKSVVVDTAGTIADSINIYVNGDNIRYLEGLETVLVNGDKVNIIPAAAAG